MTNTFSIVVGQKPLKNFPAGTFFHVSLIKYLQCPYSKKPPLPWKISYWAHAVFLTRVDILQMPTWLPTWKAKSLYHVGTFLPTWFFLPLQKFKAIKISIPKQIRAHYIFQGILKTFLNIYALLFIFRKLWTIEKVESSLSIVAVCHVFFNRYSIQSV